MSAGGSFRLPLKTWEAWGLLDQEERSNEDIAADLDYIDRALENFVSNVTDPSTTATFGSSLDRGRELVTMPNDTITDSTALFTTTFSTAPRVILTVECALGQDLVGMATVVGTSSFSYNVRASTVSTATLYVHWVAISAS